MIPQRIIHSLGSKLDAVADSGGSRSQVLTGRGCSRYNSDVTAARSCSLECAHLAETHPLLALS